MLNDKAKLRRIRAAMEVALKQVGEGEGITFDLGNMRFDPDGTQCSMKLTMHSGTEQKDASTRDLERYGPVTCYHPDIEKRSYSEGNPSLVCIRAADIGKEFTANGKTYTLVGYKPRASKFRWVARSATGDLVMWTDGTLYRFAKEWRGE